MHGNPVIGKNTVGRKRLGGIFIKKDINTVDFKLFYKEIKRFLGRVLCKEIVFLKLFLKLV